MQILRDDIKYIIHCDEQGNIIGPFSKIHAHLPAVRPALTHYATWSMLFHLPSGRYGLQLKNKRKGGKWDMGIAGHNCYVKAEDGYSPMGFEETLVKEAEEVDLKVTVISDLAEFAKLAKEPLTEPIAFIFEKFHYHTEQNNEFVELAFVLTAVEDVKFNDGEVVDFKWLKPEELANYLKNYSDYCDPLALVFQKAEQFRSCTFHSSFQGWRTSRNRSVAKSSV